MARAAFFVNDPHVMLEYIHAKASEQEYTLSTIIYNKLATISILRGLGETVSLAEAAEPRDLSADEAQTLAREQEEIQTKAHKQRQSQRQGEPWSQYLR